MKQNFSLSDLGRMRIKMIVKRTEAFLPYSRGIRPSLQWSMCDDTTHYEDILVKEMRWSLLEMVLPSNYFSVS